MPRARRLLSILLIVASASPCHSQELVSEYWDVGAWKPGASGIWPTVQTASDTTNRALDVQGFGTVQYSPGAMLRGAFWNWPSAGGVGWQLGMTWDWSHDRFYSNGHVEHWRVAGVRAVRQRSSVPGRSLRRPSRALFSRCAAPFCCPCPKLACGGAGDGSSDQVLCFARTPKVRRTVQASGR